MYLKQRIKKQIISLALISTALLSAGCLSKTKPSAIAPSSPLTGEIISMATGQPLSYPQLLDQLKNRRFILLGEKHDNPEHHQRELQLLKSLQQGKHTRVVLEMLDEAQAKHIEQLSAHSSDEEIQTTLNWNDGHWPWQDYGPLINAALKDHNQLNSGNISKPLVMQIYQQTLAEQPRLSTVKAIPADIQKTIQQQVYDSHCQMIPLDQMGPMTQVQLSRDASMAYALSDNLEDNMQAILIAGSFHARKDTGVPLHLQQRSAAAAASILLVEVDTKSNTIEAAIAPYVGMADYLWFTDKSAEKDYCASLQQQSHQQSEDE